MKHKRDREDPCHVCSHYHDYERGEPCSICGHVMTTTERRQQESVLPTAIIPGSLYLGSYDTASRSEILKAMGISHILNTVANNQALFKNTFTYHTATSSPPDLQECFAFIDEATKHNHKVLVYCMSGTSRSPTVVISYLMKHRQWRLAESYKWVKEKRPSVNIKPEDAARLTAYERELFGSTSVPMGLQALDASAGGAPAFAFGGSGAATQGQQQPSSSGSVPCFTAGAPAFVNGTADATPWSMSSASTAQPLTFGACQPLSFTAGSGAGGGSGGGTGQGGAAAGHSNSTANDMEM